MTSESTFRRRFTKIDELTRSDHGYLSRDDACYFLGEYTAGTGFTHSATNDLILNFKKLMDRRDKPEWRYKDQAIQQAAAAFGTALGSEELDLLTFVPIPPSKAKDDPLYDDRMVRMLRAIRPEPALDVRELVIQKRSTEAVHDTEHRPSPDEIAELYEIDDVLATPAPDVIAIVDDVLTTGAHFRAGKSILSNRFPEIWIVGFFLARRVP